MNYKLTTPCKSCPYLIGSGFTWASLKLHASGEFGCHNVCDLNDETGTYEPHHKTPHCAGALIFLDGTTRLDPPLRCLRRPGKALAVPRAKLAVRSNGDFTPPHCAPRSCSTLLERHFGWVGDPGEPRRPLMCDSQTKVGDTDMARGRESFEKRARELKRQTRAANKRDRREERDVAGTDLPPVDEDALMARYGELGKLREVGEIDEAEFERARLEIFVELGLVTVGDD